VREWERVRVGEQDSADRDPSRRHSSTYTLGARGLYYRGKNAAIKIKTSSALGVAGFHIN
jgi:hypothetical protein